MQQEFTSYLGISSFYNREAELVIYRETPASKNPGLLPCWTNMGPVNKKTQNYNWRKGTPSNAATSRLIGKCVWLESSTS